MNLKLLNHAKEYIEKLANGVNPLTNESIPENEVVNNVSISRCLFYVNGILEKLLQEEMRGNSKKKSLNYSMIQTNLINFEYSMEAISLSDIVKKINTILIPEDMQKLSARKVHDWLLFKGILYEEIIDDKKYKRPTSLGNDIGIRTEERTSFQGMPYKVNVYNKNAQMFIIDNLESLCDFINSMKN